MSNHNGESARQVSDEQRRQQQVSDSESLEGFTAWESEGGASKGDPGVRHIPARDEDNPPCRQGLAMRVLKGIPISPGYAEGLAVVYDYEAQRRFVAPPYAVSHAEVHQEHRRLDAAAEQSGHELERAEEAARSELGLVEAAAILSAHSQLLRELAEKVHLHVGEGLVTVEKALEVVISDVVRRLGKLDNLYIREREQDVRDVGRRILRHLTGAPEWPPESLPAGSVVVARELLPSEIIALARSGAVAFLAEQGGKNSHTAILARSLGIPAISGIAEVTAQIRPGMRLLLNAVSGDVTVNPTEPDRKAFFQHKREYDRSSVNLVADEAEPCVTQDGVEIRLLANVGRPEEVEQVVQYNLGGIGLFRTEFLFLEAVEPPNFESQCDVYKRAADALQDRPLVIRTFDLGGDKVPPFLLSHRNGPHPSLALRGLRFSLAERSLFEIQLRAIVQVAQERDVRVLFPMVIGSHDLALARAALDTATSDLGAKRRPPLGAMIETPAALFALEEILQMADFLAIGTNDLTQYMLALDRDEAELSDECTPWHPSVLRAVKHVIDAADIRKCPTCVCGEEAGEPDFARLLVGLGVRELSLSAGRTPRIREALNSVTCRELESLAQQALGCNCPEGARRMMGQLVG